MTVIADQFQVKIFWQSAHSLVAGRAYVMVRGNELIQFKVTAIKYREQQDTREHLSAKKISANEFAVINISTSSTLAFDGLVDAEFAVEDELTKARLGGGTIEFALHRANNISWQWLIVNKSARAQLKHQQPRCIWLTGLSGSGKSTIANLLEKCLLDKGLHTYLLDGDNLRHGLNRDLGFTEADRVENIRRVAEVSRLMVDAGLIVLASFISPYSAERNMARKLFEPGEFVEVFVDASLQECERRDVKGLYAKARRGELKNFTGIDSVYECPSDPELHLDTAKQSPEACVEQIVALLNLC